MKYGIKNKVSMELVKKNLELVAEITAKEVIYYRMKLLKTGHILMNPKGYIGLDGDDFVRRLATVIVYADHYKIPRYLKPIHIKKIAQQKEIPLTSYIG